MSLSTPGGRSVFRLGIDGRSPQPQLALERRRLHTLWRLETPPQGLAMLNTSNRSVKTLRSRRSQGPCRCFV
jgi:hypothetical protein